MKREGEREADGREEGRGGKEHHLRRHIWTVCPGLWDGREVKQSADLQRSSVGSVSGEGPIGAEIFLPMKEGWRPLNAENSSLLAVSGAAAVESGAAHAPEREGVIDNRAQERTRGMISHLCVGPLTQE